jgi:hypothetical protein
MIYTVVLMLRSLCLMVSKELNVHTCKTHENPVPFQIYQLDLIFLVCLTSLSAIFQLYHDDQF